MNRRTFLCGLTLGTLGLPFAGEAQQVGKLPRIGVLAPAEPSASDPVLEGFRVGLRELGYVDGRNIVVEYLYAHGQPERFGDLAAELARRNVDVAVVGSTRAALATKEALQTTPIVFVGAVDPVAVGLVASLGRPGGHVTGFSFAFEEGLSGKSLELLHEAVPRAARIAILRHAGYPPLGSIATDTDRAGRALGLKLQRFEVHGADGLSSAFGAIARERAEALLVEPVPFFNTHQRRVVELAGRQRLPGMYPFRSFVDAGGLMSYGVSLFDLWRRSATHVDKILKGAKPADIPVERPTKFELVINLKTAKALRLTIPQALLQRADEVIQ